MERYGHYFGSKKEAYLIISTTMQPIGEKIIVAGKKEAKKLCKELGVQPWNF